MSHPKRSVPRIPENPYHCFGVVPASISLPATNYRVELNAPIQPSGSEFWNQSPAQMDVMHASSLKFIVT
jgi:hypothetical protein